LGRAALLGALSQGDSACKAGRALSEFHLFLARGTLGLFPIHVDLCYNRANSQMEGQPWTK